MRSSLIYLILVFGAFGAGPDGRADSPILDCYRDFLQSVKNNRAPDAIRDFVPINGKPSDDATLFVSTLISPRRLHSAALAAFGNVPDEWDTGVISDDEIDSVIKGLSSAKVSIVRQAAKLDVVTSNAGHEVLTKAVAFKLVEGKWKLDPVQWGDLHPGNPEEAAWKAEISKGTNAMNRVTDEIANGKLRSINEAERRLKELLSQDASKDRASNGPSTKP